MKLTKSMSLQLKTILFNKNFLFFVFLLVHILLFNVNKAEWGDSYRMLRASEFVRKGAYPEDEKRPPLFPILLAIRPQSIEPIVWGRSVVLIISILYFLLFCSFTEKIIKDKRFLLIAKLLFIFNPVLLYWSLRIMSDIPFGFMSFLVLYWVYLWGKDLDFGKALLLGFLSGLAVFLRFEGYLLAFSAFMGIVLNGITISKIDLKFKRIFAVIKSNLFNSMVFLFTFIITILPYIIYKNPLGTSYLEEPSGRSYDLKMFLIYIVSLTFLFGIIPALYFIGRGYKTFSNFFFKNISFTFFVVMELGLILLWPAAIPRLFVSIIPILIIPLVLCMKEYFSDKKLHKMFFWLFNPLIFTLFILGQYFLKLQFLVPQRWWFVLLLIIQIPMIISIYKKNLRIFISILVLNLITWSISPIYLHKDTFISVKKAADYTLTNLHGTVAYNDVSSVSDWYLNYMSKGGLLKGHYYNTESKKMLSLEALRSLGADYLLITNEHNPTMTLDLSLRPYLEEITEFRYNINGKVFFTKIIRFNKEYRE